MLSSGTWNCFVPVLVKKAMLLFTVQTTCEGPAATVQSGGFHPVFVMPVKSESMLVRDGPTSSIASRSFAGPTSLPGGVRCGVSIMPLRTATSPGSGSWICCAKVRVSMIVAAHDPRPTPSSSTIGTAS